MKKKYIAFGGEGISTHDKGIHYISATEIPHLYNVREEECIIVSSDRQFKGGYDKNHGLIELHPDSSGQYTTLNESIKKTMTNKQKIRALRNKAIPPVLEFGCEVEVAKDRGTIYKFSESGTPYVTWDDGIFDSQQGRSTIKNLGKPVSLPDVLRMIEDGGYECYIAEGKITLPLNNDNAVTLDLTIPIEEHSDEVLGQLISILE